MQIKEVLTKLKKLDQEILKRKAKNKLSEYNTGKVVHKKQMIFHKSIKRNRWVFGGNRSGKSQCGAVEAIWMARGIHPFRENRRDVEGWVVSLTQQVQRDVAQQKVLYYLNPDWIEDVVMLSGKKSAPSSGVIDYIVIKNVFGGRSKIGFKTCDQGREKFQGTSLDFVWFDEEPPRDIYIECKMRVMDRCGDVFGTMTPLKGLTWVYDEIYLNSHDDKVIFVVEMEWADNPYLKQSEIEQMAKTLGESELESRRYGKFGVDCGLVYKEFDPNVHIIEPFNVPYEWYDKISIDPGLNNPTSCHWYAVDYDSNVYVIAEHYEAQQNVDYHSRMIKAKCEELKWPRRNGEYIEALIDPAANQRTLASAKSVSELFYDNGILVNTKVNKDLFSGISRVKSYLKNGKGEVKLYIFKTCVNMIREIKSYWWGNADAPIKKDDHAMDDLRYYIMSRPDVPIKEEQALSRIEQHRDKIMQRNRWNKRKLM
ncbi:MAG: terminase family protein [Clostridia bacterium]|nr:terminase family protein [Clostridia bacterium]